MKLRVVMEQGGIARDVGVLEVFRTAGKEHYAFVYESDWVKAGFSIDPTMPLVPGYRHVTQELPGAFQDISPDRWGRLVQQRLNGGGHRSAADFMLGVSDFMRQGALRLADLDSPDVFLAGHGHVPRLVDLRRLQHAAEQVDAGRETEADLAELFGPGTSLGGAHPKAAVVDQEGSLFLAKFQSRNDGDVRISSWEATMLDLAEIAGIRAAQRTLLNAHAERPVLLVRRFDRNAQGRVHFASAMTLSGLGETDRDTYSYADLAGVVNVASTQPKADSLELWTRMTFNAMFGNTDDHLRNHGFMAEGGHWRLSPAYDLNPTVIPLARRRHALAFMPGEFAPSLALCREVGGYFNLSDQEMDEAQVLLGRAFDQWRFVARRNGLSASECRVMEHSFEHEDAERLRYAASHDYSGTTPS